MAVSPQGRLPYKAPLPKINLPPSIEAAIEPRAPFPTSNPWIAEPVTVDEPVAAETNRRRNPWNLRFALSLVMLTLVANLALAKLLDTDGGEIFLTDTLPADGDELSGLSPAAGQVGPAGTTVYFATTASAPELPPEPSVTPGAVAPQVTQPTTAATVETPVSVAP